MGSIQPPKPVLRLVAISSRHEAALAWARERIATEFGPHAAVSDAMPYDDTDYYEQEMGSGLLKQFVVSDALMNPDTLPALKIQTNEWEQQYANAADHPEPRPLNLDPGYLTESKLVLASTKNHSHRIYLSQGIYAEITLGYTRSAGWVSHRWTYPDYQRTDYQQFFTTSRQALREKLRTGKPLV